MKTQLCIEIKDSMNTDNQTFPSLKGLRLLFLATYPPPFGGIASHLKTLMPALIKGGAADIAVVGFGAKN
jgi:hypothetical protein